MRIGGESSPRMTVSNRSMIFGIVTAPMGDGSALSASTSTSKPGYAGAEIHEDDVGPFFPVERERFLSVRRFGHERDVRFRREHGPEACPNEGVVVDNKN